MAELKYTQDHECVYLDGQEALVGITDYAREALGDLVFVELPEVGANLSKGDSFAVVESVKTAADVYTPVSGEVTAANDAMPDDLDLIAKPLSEGGWIAKIKVSDMSELDGLMDEAAYQDYLKTLD